MEGGATFCAKFCGPSCVAEDEFAVLYILVFELAQKRSLTTLTSGEGQG